MTQQTAKRLHKSLPFAAVLAGMLLAGCQTGGYDSFSYQEVHEIPQGAGLITDNSGEYTVFSRDLSGGGSGSQTSTQTVSAPQVSTSSGITEAATPE